MNLASQTLDTTQPTRGEVSLDAFKELYTLHQNFAPSPFTSSEKSSPSLSPHHKYFEACQLNTELLGEEIMRDQNAQVEFHAKMNKQQDFGTSPTIGSKNKSTSAERRAAHNAIERARRESLNARFLELARALPTMANVKRPSKNAIVIKSLEWICESQII
ncbi:hypothetical protein BY996DRAFT_2047367 [Phakopsora pachyrhizi]|nr:hypothetical protein BY996DRAFT_2047367 [Phakopsora pachyrhizi]